MPSLNAYESAYILRKGERVEMIGNRATMYYFNPESLPKKFPHYSQWIQPSPGRQGRIQDLEKPKTTTLAEVLKEYYRIPFSERLQQDIDLAPHFLPPEEEARRKAERLAKQVVVKKLSQQYGVPEGALQLFYNPEDMEAWAKGQYEKELLRISKLSLADWLHELEKVPEMEWGDEKPAKETEELTTLDILGYILLFFSVVIVVFLIFNVVMDVFWR